MSAAEVKSNQLYLMTSQKKDIQNGACPPVHIIKISYSIWREAGCQVKKAYTHHRFFSTVLEGRELLDSWSQVPSDLLLETLMIKVITPNECLITLNITSRFNSAIFVSSTACHSLVQELCYLGL